MALDIGIPTAVMRHGCGRQGYSQQLIGPSVLITWCMMGLLSPGTDHHHRRASSFPIQGCGGRATPMVSLDPERNGQFADRHRHRPRIFGIWVGTTPSSAFLGQSRPNQVHALTLAVRCYPSITRGLPCPLWLAKWENRSARGAEPPSEDPQSADLSALG